MIQNCWKSYILFYLSLWLNLNKSQKWKKASPSGEIDYVEEVKKFLQFLTPTFSSCPPDHLQDN